MTPRVSVILPTRDRLDKLRCALASVERQRFRDFEIIVVDDGSTDDTASWLHSQCFTAQVLRMETTGGAAHARNQGLARARGELIEFLDDDDLWPPAYLEAQVEHLDAHPAATLSYADHVERHANGHTTRPDTQPLLTYPNPLIRLLAESFIHTMSVVVCRREAFDRFGQFNEQFAIVHDLDWYGRILVGGGSFVYLPRTLVERRVPGGLVTAHRKWFWEEHTAHTHALMANPTVARHEHLVRAYRSLFFARIGLAEQDWSFGITRLLMAFFASPYWTMRITALRLLRRLQFEHRVS